MFRLAKETKKNKSEKKPFYQLKLDQCVVLYRIIRFAGSSRKTPNVVPCEKKSLY